MTKSIILLVDNGSKKAEATVQLRRIAQQLGERVGQTIHPVSLQHADKIDMQKWGGVLGGIKPSVFATFIKEQLQQEPLEHKQCRFVVLPLFFGNSRALTKFIPDTLAALEQEFGKFDVTLADTLYPLSKTDPRLPKIIFDNIQKVSQQSSQPLENIVLVDHGSPSPQITQVRHGVADELQALLGDTPLSQAVMERRAGKQYDFNGELLEDWLLTKAEQSEDGKVNSAIVALLFSLPGRHAGAGGDIESMCELVMQRYPNFKIAITPLVGEHPLLLEILANRLNA